MTKECRRHWAQALWASQAGVFRLDSWVGGSARHLKISHKPDQTAQRKWYWLWADQTWSLFTWTITHRLHDCNTRWISVYVFVSPFGWSRNTMESTISFKSRMLIKTIWWNHSCWSCHAFALQFFQLQAFATFRCLSSKLWKGSDVTHVFLK